MASPLDRLSYAARQAARVTWYAGHYAAGLRLMKPMPKPDFAIGPTPNRAEMTADIRSLFAREWQDIAAGLFPAPLILAPDPARLLQRSLLYFRDLPKVDARRHGRLDDELRPGQQDAGLPEYYRQNFHFQSGGWLSDESATLYDTQVEVLFTGAADVMRRRALKPIAEWMAGRNQRTLRGLDVGCGTGRLLAFLHAAWPGVRFTGLDLSAPYLEEARRIIGRTARAKLIEGAAETLPFDDASLDLVVSSYLLHELPAEVRLKALAEMARVAKPDGLIVIVESIQKGDRPEWDGLLDLFPHYFHEPYYADYVGSRLDHCAAEAGLTPIASEQAFLSKVTALKKDRT
ncbi:Ubiquinone/menaquinone biosynthesis C-methylase UbiE [Enhydrobacter aerosaccus]|uniref:Ubiquinone/menaquinone biosynthesis C-methylase UbiE n=1 Tax=Enhydrobacter aerosaccus TaxID=225324 RepID=A0A1T4QAA4_9HYPH|nr:class I SAM-dependent methyltransferase [Enhydrobacter aerosaccus]SKA00556.1 Ubiquinone/menaquinone biosynthesis C-methylase UbiE [Enhydrobacter aerosaccus]